MLSLSPQNTPAAFKIAVVTGASSGIGRATAHALLQQGYRCFGLARRLPEASIDVDENRMNTPAACAAQRNRGIEWIQTDIRDAASVQAAVAEIKALAGRIDLLVNNAGIGLIAASEESSAEQIQALFATNVLGLISMTNAVLPLMRAQASGRIIQISSVAGYVPTPFMSLYTATKHAVEGYAESLDHELQEHGIRCVIVQPGFTRSAINANAPQPDLPHAAFNLRRSAMARLVNASGARAGTPEKVAQVILQAALAPKPRARYRCGADAHALHFLRRFLPARIFAQLLRTQFKLDAELAPGASDGSALHSAQ